ncbi:MAG TPA: hypothetical protein VK670_04335, partial [Silvibacterium sp.]|nr:hypothetical protein [Silvibacterium sp.]
ASGLAQIAVSTLLRLNAQPNGKLCTRSAVDTALEIWRSPRSRSLKKAGVADSVAEKIHSELA